MQGFFDRHPVLRAIALVVLTAGGLLMFFGLLLIAWWMIAIACGGFCP